LPSTTANNSRYASGRASRGNAGHDLRAARERAGLTRCQLAGLAGCAISSLGFIEQGAVPARSAVLDRAWAVIEQLENERAGRTT
jgi:transcriptional regulator with XRE-family HTH domain